MTRRLLFYLDDADTAEALAFGYGAPPGSIRRELRTIWWRLRVHGVHLPAERRIIVVGGRLA